jgi:hypothetical protein
MDLSHAFAPEQVPTFRRFLAYRIVENDVYEPPPPSHVVHVDDDSDNVVHVDDDSDNDSDVVIL